MPARLRPADPDDVAAALARRSAGESDPVSQRATTRLLVKHSLALLATEHPGASLEVRVPPFGAVQCLAGARHTRGTPPAVVEADAVTWLALATGEESWADALASGRLHASGERSDLSPLLPLLP